ncbi:trypsin-like peptidase domain-containing protein [Streptomyces ipomoeae]|uniref:nSTAND1 domain-containing NTPase n=1 Tax=Streptomyces ipomoeae TaxID=103232 RepID=UPI001147989E|nr:trypsin-like peptidase domain-containing protein [Streptomyces ipomoeae]MDX2939089.1 trypsin-like peptidase domain-containing protein [Streptomyces ipomoeae]TQE20551.1 NACHT domain-containing protein [Streptomyces ipomoeae]
MTPAPTVDAPTSDAGTGVLEAAVLQIRDQQGEPVGLGFLVTEDLALTCAHVVNAALGIPPGTEPATSARIDVTLPLLRTPAVGVPAGAATAPQITARVERWVAPHPSGAGDVAALRLSDVVPGSRPIRLVDEPDLWEHPARVFGFPEGRSGGVWHAAVLRARQANGWVQADLAANGYRVSGGFSGSPVWDGELKGVVGMMALAERGEPPASYLIPAADLMNAWPALRPLVLPPSPFRRLLAFEEADAAVFHGRTAESEAVTAMVAGERWTAIVGPSGSGKSSLARAGVVPKLRRDGASVLVLRPSAGSTPTAGLALELLALLEPGLSEADRLAQAPTLTGVLARKGGLADVVPRLLRQQGNRRLLVVIDQFEELLAHETAAVDELAGVLFDENLPDTVRVLTTLRADFLSAVLAHPRLGHAFDGRRVYALGPMRPDQLRDIVTLPVAAVPGVHYEPHLVDRILEDTGTEPGALPLLGFALDQLWREQQLTHGWLTHDAYKKIGGVTGALRDHLVEVWARHVRTPEDEKAARRLFTQLIRVPLESAGVTRRVVTRSELGDAEWRVAQRLATTRLLVTGRDTEGTETVELAHEALISSWDKLADWAAEDRSFLVWRESLRHDRRRWDDAGRPPELLPTPIDLANARPWLEAEARRDALTEAETEYLELGRTHHRARTRRRKALRSGFSILVALVVLFGTLFGYAQRESRERQALANSRALAQYSQDQVQFDPVLSVKLALAAYETAPTQEARNQLLRQYLAFSDSTRVLSGLLGTVEQFQTSRDGDVVFARSAFGRATLFVRALNGTVRSQQFARKQVIMAMVSADGSRAAFICDDGTAGWFEVRPDGDRLIGTVHELPRVKDFTVYTFESRNGFALSTDGRIMAVRAEKDVLWWDLDSGTIGGRVPLPKDVGGKLWIGADNRSLLVETSVYNGERYRMGLAVVDMATGRSRTVVRDADDILVSGDRSAVAVCRTEDSHASVTLRRISDGTQQGRGYDAGEYASCEMQAVDATGRHFVVKDGTTLSLVDLVRGKLISRATQLDGITATQWDLVSSGGELFLAGHSGSLINYVEVSTKPNILSVAEQKLSADGSRTISLLDEGKGLVVYSATAQAGEPPIARADRPRPYWYPEDGYQLVLNSGRTLLADWDSETTVSVRKVSTLRRTVRITVPKPPSTSEFDYFFDRKSHLVTVSGTRVQQWDTSTGRELAHFDIKSIIARSRGAETPPTVHVGRYPADNQVAVLLWGDPTVHVVDLTTGRTTATVKVPTDTVATQFARGGHYFAVLRSGGIVELWRRDPLRKELGPLRSVAEDGGQPYVAGFIDDEGGFAVAANSSVRIYEAGSRSYRDSYDFGRAPSSSILAGGGYFFRDMSEDAGTVLYQNSDGKGGPLRLDPTQWRRDLCAVIGDQTFTPTEKAGLPVRIPPQPICP